MTELRTPLYEVAAGAGASFQEWHGWKLPHAYGDVPAEYRAAREGAALHDASYVGRIRATGDDVLDLLHRLSTNDLASIPHGQGAPTILTSDRGRIIDLVTVLNLGDHVLLLTSPETPETVLQWLDKYTIVEDVTLEDVTASTAMISVMGPNAASLLGTLSCMDLASFQVHQSSQGTIAGVQCYIVRRELGNIPRYEVVVQGDDAEQVWREVAATAKPLGHQAYEALRVEEGVPEYGAELGESYNPLEAGLWGSISFNKGCYIGQEVIARLDTYQKVQRHLVSLSFAHDASVRPGIKLAWEGKEVGQVTSVAGVPTTGAQIGMGYVRKGAAEVGSRLSLAGDEESGATVEAPVLPYGPGEAT